MHGPRDTARNELFKATALELKASKASADFEVSKLLKLVAKPPAARRGAERAGATFEEVSSKGTMALRRSLIFFLRSDAEAPLSRVAPPEHDQRAKSGRCGDGDEWHTETECTAGELLRGFHAVRVERRIPVRRAQGFVCGYSVQP